MGARVMKKLEPKTLAEYTEAAILDEIRRVAALVKEPCLTQAAFRRHGRVRPSVVSRRFGSWQTALACAGLGRRYWAWSPTEKWSMQRLRHTSNEELAAELRRVARKLGRATLKRAELKRHGRIRTHILELRFGSWRAALAAAGLEVARTERRHTDEDLLGNLVAFWLRLRRPPMGEEMRRPQSRVSTKTYVARFGSWRHALAAAQAWAEARGIAPGTPAAHELVAREHRARQNAGRRRAARRDRGGPSGRRARRSPATRSLRLAIFERDHFRCLACGRSPATDAGCTLQVDHIVPASQGGPTTPDNLRTLCAECNLGRGDGRGRT
jgi:5-methylcytosine-specific restriction endonuclease McrA